MKTILLLFFALAIVAGASAQKPEAVAIKSSGMELKIDGVLDEAIWASAEKYQIDSVFNGEEIAGGAADCSGYFQVAWSNSGIYVAVTVTDDSTNVTGPQGQNWAWDMVEIYLDMNAGNLADTLGPQGGKGHYQIAGLAKDGAAKWGTNSKFAYKTDGSNYVKETFVRWSDLKDKKGNIVSASDSLELGFDIYIVDNDRDSVASARQFRDRLVWSNKGEIGEAYGNMNDAGILKFNVDSAVVNPYVTVSSKVKGMPLTVDGVLDEAVWKNAEKYQIETPFKGEEIAGGAADCSGYFQTLWNYQGIYIAVTVTDDSTNVTGPQGQNWAWDMVEIYLDMNAGNLKDSLGPQGGKGHYQIAGLAKDGAAKWGTNSSYAYKTTGSNYVKEAFIKWSDLKDANGNAITPTDSVEIGFDMYIVDNDRDSVASARQFRDRLVWSNNGEIGEAYSNMNDAGILKFDVTTAASVNPAVATISKVTGDTIVANGILDESVWADAAKINIEQVYKGEKITGGAKDCSGYFQTVWNENGIYIAVTVTDDSTNVTGPQGPNWAWDMVEIYFDANVGNLKDGRGPQENLGHYQVAGLAKDGTSKWATSSVISYLTNKSSYIKETFVSWADLKDSAGVALTPAKDMKIGFDVYIIDNDRDSLASTRNFRDRLVWANWGDITESYDKMDDAGVIVLSNTEIVNDYDFVSVSEKKLISEAMVYPNPARDVLYIQNVSEKAVVSILSIDGRIMLQSKGSSMININTLQKGLYFVRVNDQNKITNKRIVIK